MISHGCPATVNDNIQHKKLKPQLIGVLDKNISGNFGRSPEK